MVNLEQLDALDTLLWMRGSSAAGKATYSSQSTIIRRSRQALRILGIDLYRGRNQWRILGDQVLLDLERQVHQEARFQGRRRLRLHMPWWTSRLLLLHAESGEQLTDRWVCHPHAVQDRADDPISLLKERVIDACLVTPTQLPSVDSELHAFDVYKDYIHLIAFTGDGARLVPEKGDAAGCRLKLFDFLPHSCKHASKLWFERRCGIENLDSRESEDSLPFVDVAYLTATMTQALEIAVGQDRSSPRPYIEQLVVRKDYQDHPAVQQLLSELSGRLGHSRQADLPSVGA